MLDEPGVGAASGKQRERLKGRRSAGRQDGPASAARGMAPRAGPGAAGGALLYGKASVLLAGEGGRGQGRFGQGGERWEGDKGGGEAAKGRGCHGGHHTLAAGLGWHW